jgi:hypothetical protein
MQITVVFKWIFDQDLLWPISNSISLAVAKCRTRIAKQFFILCILNILGENVQIPKKPTREGYLSDQGTK